jgi:hypothetical protein
VLLCALLLPLLWPPVVRCGWRRSSRRSSCRRAAVRAAPALSVLRCALSAAPRRARGGLPVPRGRAYAAKQRGRQTARDSAAPAVFVAEHAE